MGEKRSGRLTRLGYMLATAVILAGALLWLSSGLLTPGYVSVVGVARAAKCGHSCGPNSVDIFAFCGGGGVKDCDNCRCGLDCCPADGLPDLDCTSSACYYCCAGCPGGCGGPGPTATPIPDNTAPATSYSLAGTLGSGGWYRTNVTVTLSATDSGTSGGPASGVKNTFYSLTGSTGPWTTYSGPFTVSTQGTTNFWYYSVDNRNNTETVKTASFKIDSIRPVSSASPSGTLAASGWYTSTTNLNFSATDASPGSGVSQREYRLSTSGAFTIIAGAGPSSVMLPEGSYPLQYRSRDVAGNVEATRSLGTIQVDSVAPACSVTSPANGARIWGVRTVSGNASDATSGLANIEISFDNGVTSASAGSTSPWSYAWNTATVADGIYQAGCRATDVAGNVGPWSWITVTVDNYPNLTLTADYANLPLYAPSVGQPAQTLRGAATGGPGAPYTLTIQVISPLGGFSRNYTVTTDGGGNFTLTPVLAADVNFGTEESGLWQARASYLGAAFSNWVTWEIKYALPHGTK